MMARIKTSKVNSNDPTTGGIFNPNYEDFEKLGDIIKSYGK
jgi:hypothetical protein